MFACVVACVCLCACVRAFVSECVSVTVRVRVCVCVQYTALAALSSWRAAHSVPEEAIVFLRAVNWARFCLCLHDVAM